METGHLHFNSRGIHQTSQTDEQNIVNVTMVFETNLSRAKQY